MIRSDLTDNQWVRIDPFMRGGRRGKRGDNRTFLNVIIWMALWGARWSDLPKRFGKVSTIKRRCYRWVEDGVLDQLLEALAALADTEWVAVDSTAIKAHPRAGGAPLKKGALRPAAWAGPAALARNCASQPMLYSFDGEQFFLVWVIPPKPELL